MKQLTARQQGFTLLEVLIALVLMAVVSVISWQALDMVERSSERLTASADDTLALVRVLGQIESDISHYANNDILPAPIQADPLSGQNIGSPSSAGSASSGAVLLPFGILWTGSTLTVARSVRAGTWRRVSWRKDGDTLRRAVGLASNTLPLPTAGIGDVVLDHVKGFNVRAWVPGRGWSSLDAKGMPLAATGLEIIIQRQHNKVDETYRKVVLLP